MNTFSSVGGGVGGADKKFDAGVDVFIFEYGKNQGRWEEAEKLFVQVKDTFLRVLGEEHPPR
jgi:hypothetical protein